MTALRPVYVVKKQIAQRHHDAVASAARRAIWTGEPKRCALGGVAWYPRSPCGSSMARNVSYCRVLVR